MRARLPSLELMLKPRCTLHASDRKDLKIQSTQTPNQVAALLANSSPGDCDKGCKEFNGGSWFFLRLNGG